MLGTIINTVAVLIGTAIGLLMKKGLPERLADSIMKGLGLNMLGITKIKVMNYIPAVFLPILLCQFM